MNLQVTEIDESGTSLQREGNETHAEEPENSHNQNVADAAFLWRTLSIQKTTIRVEKFDPSDSSTHVPRLEMRIETKDGKAHRHILSTEEKNSIVRNNPEAVMATFQDAKERRLANRRGYFEDAGCYVSWKPSYIPFHVEYTFVQDNIGCQHLASVKDEKTKDPLQYGKDLLPLARSFTERPFGSIQPRFPFSWLPADGSTPGSTDSEESMARRTTAHAAQLMSDWPDPEEMDFTPAEDTARLINTNMIMSSLLKLILDSRPNRIPAPLSEASEFERKWLETLGLEESSSPSPTGSGMKTDMSNKENITESNKSRSIDALVNTIADTEPSQTSKRLFTHLDQGQVQPKQFHQDENPDQRQNERPLAFTEKHNGADIIQHMKGQTSAEPKVSKKKRKAQKRRPKAARAVQESVQVDSGVESRLLAHQNSLSTLTNDNHEHLVNQPTGGIVATKHSTSHTSSPEQYFFDTEGSFSDLEFFDARGSMSDEDAKSLTEIALNPQHTILSQPPTSNLSPMNNPIQHNSDSMSSTVESELSPETKPVQHDAESVSSITGPELALETKPIQHESKSNSSTSEPDLSLERLSVEDEGEQHDTDNTSSKDPNWLTRENTEGIGWTYHMNKEVDDKLLGMGVWLWHKPNTYYRSRVLPKLGRDPTKLAPVFLDDDTPFKGVPKIRYNSERVCITPHSVPWKDVRSSVKHPDYLPPSELVKYQAFEFCGYPVNRHDRIIWKCHKPGCDAIITDENRYTIICFGCGPKTGVRYCTFQHQIQHSKEHWPECGSPDMVLEEVFDRTTDFKIFFAKPPAIIEMNGIKSAYLHQQKTAFMDNGGKYTIFSSYGQPLMGVGYPSTHRNSQELNARIERMLNIAFLDTQQSDIINYVYRSLHEALTLSGPFVSGVYEVFKLQFQSEFPICDPAVLNNGPTSEGDWSGLTGRAHRKNPKPGVKKTVEELEKKYWILRAWRTQDETEKDWGVRANGYEEVEEGENRCVLGPGFIGWGSKETNMLA